MPARGTAGKAASRFSVKSIVPKAVPAAATAAGAAGLAVVRLAGPSALTIGAGMFAGRAALAEAESHRAHHGWVVDAAGERTDEVLALVLRAPHGYTGEDTVEFSCHGSMQVVDEIVAAALAGGARLAEPGEFTRRAFLNGKIDLVQAEAVADARRTGALLRRTDRRVARHRHGYFRRGGESEHGLPFFTARHLPADAAERPPRRVARQSGERTDVRT